ncbi:MAG: chemotaxis protein CheW [Planctomycetota bacterium]
MNQQTLDNSERFCVFSCDENWYGVPALAVRSIVPCPELTDVPFSDPILQGISQIQNEFLPVVSLRALTQIQYEATDQSDQQVIVLNGNGGPWGLLIDRAESLATLETSISNFSNNQDRWAKATLGSASYQDHVLQILDPNAVFDYAASLIDGFWANSE